MDNLLGVVLQLYRLAQEVPVSEFHALALEMLKAIVLFRSATWSNAQLRKGAVEIYTVHLDNEPPEVRSRFSALNRTHVRRVLAAARQPGRSHVLNDTYG